ncbi:MAG: hypothetical protein PHE50_04250 [Dehalococcoidales bacterium]|nr:hypothetical protein [Dehalococcoidales bacterium]
MTAPIYLFAFIGMLVVGYFIALVVVPFILFIMEIVVLLFSLTNSKGSQYFTNNPVKSTQESEPKINYPNNIQKFRNAKIDESKIGQIPTIQHFYKTRNDKTNKYPCYIIFQFVTDQLNKVLYIVHCKALYRIRMRASKKSEGDNK